MGAGLPAMQAARTGRYTAAMPSRASPLPQVGGWQAANSVGNALPVGAGLPAMQAARTGRCTAAMPSRASPLPQRFLASHEFSWSCITCGSWLACDADGADWQVHRSDAIASKPAPTGGGLASSEFSWSCITCGSRLACDADGADWQVHRSDAIASKPAPTGGGFRFIRSTKIPSGKKSARPNPAGAANRPAPAGR